MPIGKNSITKRVATPATTTPAKEDNIAPELVATVAAAPKTPAKKASSSAAAKKPASATAKKPAAATAKKTASTTAKKSAAPKKDTAAKATATPLVDSTVLANVSPETVAAVIGHKENTGFEKVQIGEKMPVYLL